MKKFENCFINSSDLEIIGSLGRENYWMKNNVENICKIASLLVDFLRRY